MKKTTIYQFEDGIRAMELKSKLTKMDENIFLKINK